MRMHRCLLSQGFVLATIIIGWISVAAADVQVYLEKYKVDSVDLAPGSAVEKAVKTGKEILIGLVQNDPGHAQELGFDNDAQGQRPVVGNKPFVVFEVGLQDLRAWNGANPEPLLQFANQLIFPIYVGNPVIPVNPFNVRSSLTVRLFEKDQTWKAARWGSASLIRDLVLKRTTVAPNGFLVTVPALNQNYFGFLHGPQHQLILIPLKTDRFFKEGKPLAAVLVFRRLAAEAKTVDGTPR